MLVFHSARTCKWPWIAVRLWREALAGTPNHRNVTMRTRWVDGARLVNYRILRWCGQGQPCSRIPRLLPSIDVRCKLFQLRCSCCDVLHIVDCERESLIEPLVLGILPMLPLETCQLHPSCWGHKGSLTILVLHVVFQRDDLGLIHLWQPDSTLASIY